MINKRARQIHKDYRAGYSIEELCRKYDTGFEDMKSLLSVSYDSGPALRETQVLYKTIQSLPVSRPCKTRIYNKLRRTGISSLRDLGEYTYESLLSIYGLGKTAADALKEAGLLKENA